MLYQPGELQLSWVGSGVVGGELEWVDEALLLLLVMVEAAEVEVVVMVAIV